MQCIYVKIGVPIKFLVEGALRNQEIIIEVKLDHIDYKNVAILPCSKSECINEYIFKVNHPEMHPDDGCYNIQYINTIGKYIFLILLCLKKN